MDTKLSTSDLQKVYKYLDRKTKKDFVTVNNKTQLASINTERKYLHNDVLNNGAFGFIYDTFILIPAFTSF